VRDYDSYLNKISVKSVETVHVFENSYRSYRKFTDQDAWKLGEEDAIDLIQDWINWNHKNGMSAVTIRNYFSQLNQFFYFMRLKLTSQDIKQELNFPKKMHEERYAISMEEIQKILKASNYKMQGCILALLSSGMRDGELVQLRKKDLIMGERIIVKIPAKFAKFGIARTTFLSKEAESYLRLGKLDDDDLVWGSSKSTKYARDNLIQQFNRARNKAGLDQKYDSVNRQKITPHILRSFFITKGEKVESGFGHALSGHGKYMKIYERRTLEEMLEVYNELEPHVCAFDLTLKNREIKKLRDANRELGDIKQDVEWLMKQAKFSDIIKQ